MSRRAMWTPRDLHDMRSVLIDNLVYDPKATKKFSNQQIEEKLLKEEDESDDNEVLVAQKDDAFDVRKSSSADTFFDYILNGPDTSNTHNRRSARKRSVASHINRCLYILNTRCCKKYGGTATYIGYKVKRT